jgi:uncharacterized protein with ParB-like and HNH nuclease domain/predicted transport protein
MKAFETNLLAFLRDPKQFVIPIYQRKYSWTIGECRQLLSDIMRAGKDNDINAHFIGSIVYIQEGIYNVSAIPMPLVIDGQQRLTTISILIAAFCDHIRKKGKVEGIDEEKLRSYYLLNDKEDDDLFYKLLLTKSDKETYFKIVNGKDCSDEDSHRIIDNYKFFREQIEKNSLQDIHNGFSKLIIIDVSLDKDRDNPQLIFESLNSTGLELTQADLIRNYILMDQEKKNQEVLYEDYWFPMEKSFGHAEYTDLFDRFMRDYLTIKTGKIPNIRDVYTEFKTYAKKITDINELVKNIYQYSKYFVCLALEQEKDSEIKSIFSNINTLKVDVSYPFLLKVYDDFSQDTITREGFVEILKHIESYVFRRAICGIPTNSLNKTFANLYKEINQDNYLESFKAVLLLKDSYRRFPRDEEFKEQLLIKDVYNYRGRNYLLRKLENHNRKELVNIESYTIEHIMPQNENLSNEWISMLGDGWEDIKEKYLHTLGNLTITGYNSELSDKPFIKKRNMEGGFADSPIRLNSYLAKLEIWNETEIVNRAKALSELSVQIWKYPELDQETLNKYKNLEKSKPDKSYFIEDHIHLADDSNMRPLYDELRKRILNLDSSVKEEILKLYIAYKTTTNFVDIVPQKSKLRLSLNLKYDEINDPQNICKDVTDKGRWGNGDVEVGISSFEHIDYALFLIKQAFEKLSEE